MHHELPWSHMPLSLHQLERKKRKEKTTLLSVIKEKLMVPMHSMWVLGTAVLAAWRQLCTPSNHSGLNQSGVLSVLTPTTSVECFVWCSLPC